MRAVAQPGFELFAGGCRAEFSYLTTLAKTGERVWRVTMRNAYRAHSREIVECETL